MKRLYDKNPLAFSFVLIGLYVVIMSIADGVSTDLHIEKVITAPVSILMAAFLIVWLAEYGLLREYGLCKPDADHKKYLFYIPLVIILSANFWCGVQLNLSWGETILYIVSMVCVGIIEELIFRGFLFKAMCKDNEKAAILVSSVTFGIGHIVNLLNKADLIPTLLQIAYAIAIGFLFTVIFYRSKSLIICMAVHGIFNALSVFSKDPPFNMQIITAAVLVIIPIAYGLWILNSTKKKSK